MWRRVDHSATRHNCRPLSTRVNIKSYIIMFYIIIYNILYYNIVTKSFTSNRTYNNQVIGLELGYKILLNTIFFQVFYCFQNVLKNIGFVTATIVFIYLVILQER
jgi:hypothetical protein